jgi:hypothetical protein
MLRCTPACGQISPAFSNATTIWCASGPLARRTDAYRIPASAGGLSMTSV